MELEKFLALYEDSEYIPNVQKYVNDKKEFSELRPPTNEQPPQPGEYYKHQELIGRLALFVDRLLMIHRTGTGKTCAMVRVAEYFKKNPGRLRHTYVLTRGPILKRDFRNQIVERCTKDEYLTPDVLERTKAGQKIMISKKLKEWYTITTYISFTNSVLGGEDVPESSISDETLTRKFRDTLFFVDEVHNLRSVIKGGTQTGEEYPDPEGNERKSVKTKDKEDRDTQRAYNLLWRIFHRVPGVKVILATATPMVNRVIDLYPVMNLILPENLQMSNRINYEEGSFESIVARMKPYFDGRVSYVREADIGVNVVYMGRRIEYVDPESDDRMETYSVIDASTMGDVQSAIYAYWYAQAASGGVRKGDTTVYNNERQASNFVFPAFDENHQFVPEYSVGRKGFERYVIQDPPKVYRLSDVLRNQIDPSNPTGLATLSVKFDRIIRAVDEADGESAFCFTDFKTGGGAILLGLCVETRGYTEFDTSQVILEPNPRTGRRKPLMIKTKRYAVITGDSTPAYVDTVLEVFNHPDNLHGELIKFVIASRFVREGISFANVQQIHLLGPVWHMSGIYQALSRAIRATSHIDLLNEARKNAVAQGLPPDQAKIMVKIYQHAAIPSENVGIPTGNSIDVNMYISAERKDIAVGVMMRALKMWSIDCPLMQNRNRRENDINYSPICDYLLCKYDCADLKDVRPPAVLDTDTYFPLYSISDARKLLPELAAILGLFGQVDMKFTPQLIDVLKQKLPFVTTEVLLVALWLFLKSGTQQLDAFGIPRYSDIIGSTLTLTPIHPSDHIEDPGINPSLGNYSQRLDVMGTVPLREVAFDVYSGVQIDIINKLLNMTPDMPGYDALFNSLFTESKIALIERAIILRTYQFPGPVGAEPLLDKYRDSILTFEKPVTQIEEVHRRITQKKVSRGRKLRREWNIMTDPRLKGLDIQPEKSGILVIVHTLYSALYTQSSYAVTSRIRRPEGKLRLLDTSDFPIGTSIDDIHFRDPQPAESYVYNRLIRLIRGEVFAAYEGVEIFGTVLPDRKFRIVDRTREKKHRQNARTASKGSICKHITPKLTLFEILYRLQIPTPPLPPGVNLDVYDRDYIVKQLVSEGTKLSLLNKVKNIHFLRYVFAWTAMGDVTKVQLCNIIFEKLKSMDRIVEIR